MNEWDLYWIAITNRKLEYWTEAHPKKGGGSSGGNDDDGNESEGIPEIKEVMKWILGYQIFKKINRRFQFQVQKENVKKKISRQI
jgi:hypothetical protein